MRKLTALFLLIAFTGFVHGQNKSIKVLALGEIVEIVPQGRDHNANFEVVNIIVSGKIVKKFSTNEVTFPQVIGTFSGYGGEYVLYRTSMGNGACAGGDLHVIKFRIDISTDKLSDIIVSPVLTSCLGEYPVFSLTYNKEGEIILNISNHSINLDFMNQWVENKSVTKTKKKSF